MRASFLVLLTSVTGCQVLFPLDTPSDAPGDGAGDATSIVERCPSAKVRDEFETTGAPSPFWDAAPQTMTEEGELVLEASVRRVIASHRYYPIADGQSITVEIPPNDLSQAQSFLGLRLRYDTSPSKLDGDVEHSVEFLIARGDTELRLFKSAMFQGVQEDLEDLAPYDETAHRFLRIAYDAGQHRMVLTTSADGESFIQLGQRTLPLADQGLRAVQLELVASRVSLARFASLCSDLAPARPISDLFEQFSVPGPDVPPAWQIVDRECGAASPNGADLRLAFKSTGVTNCSVTTRTAYDLSNRLTVADLAMTRAGLEARSIIALEREDRSRYQVVYRGMGADQLHAEEVSPSDEIVQASNPVIENPRFLHFHGLANGLRLEYQLFVGSEAGVELQSFSGVTVEAVRLQFALTGTSTTAAETVIRGVTPTQPTQ